MKKFFSLRVAALVSVSVFLFGCETEIEIPVPVPGPSTAIVCDEVARSFTQLRDYLKDSKVSVVGLDGEIYLTGSLTIPSGKTLYIVGGFLNTNGRNLYTNGTVYVGYGAALESTDSTSDHIYMYGGSLTVLYGGVLVLKRAGTVQRQNSSSTALGTSAVTIDGGTLVIKELWGDIADIEELFSSVKKGQFIINFLDATKGTMPSGITKIDGISKNRVLRVPLTYSAATETEKSLTIPEGLILTVNQNLANVETLEVNGGLAIDADVTISGEKTLTVNGELVVGSAKTLTVGNDVEISGILTLEKGAKLATTDTGMVKFGETTFRDIGAWTAGATGDDTDNTSLSIISGGTEAAIMFNRDDASQVGTLTATSGNPVITQAAGQDNAFYIYDYVTINLGTIGQITLESGPKPGLLAFYDGTSIVLAGAGDGTNVTSLKNLTIGGKPASVSDMKVFKNSGNKLTQLFGSNPLEWGLIYASETPGKDVEINSTAAVTTGS
jgi:hypothetical protein